MRFSNRWSTTRSARGSAEAQPHCTRKTISLTATAWVLAG